MKQPSREDDILWNMLRSELRIPEIHELQDYLQGESEHFDMGYGDLSIEPYDAGGGSSQMLRVRHRMLGEITVSNSALRSVLHDLRHHLKAVS
jgi:hypothetical protein